MSRLASLIAKYKLSEDDAMEILAHVKKAGSEKAGLEAWHKEQEANLNDMRFQLISKGFDVSEVKIDETTSGTL